MSKSLPLKPRLSEKGYALSEKQNTYVFDVPADSNRQLIAAAVEAQYGVGVMKIRVAGAAGKPKRVIRRGRITGSSKRSAVRKAYVTLKEGEKLPLFASAEDDKKTSKETK